MSSDWNERLKLAATQIGIKPHADILREYLPEFLEPEVENGFSKKGNYPLKCAIFNLEQGNFIDQIKTYFKYHTELRDLDVIFGNELDRGMNRTGNRNISREMAELLGMNYAYAIEFYLREIDPGKNSEGFHGNTIFSRYPLSNVKVINLPIGYEWFNKEGDSRLGTRIGIFAEINPEGKGKIGLACVHLENRATPQKRSEQLLYIIEEAQKHFGDIPVLIGGDMNTNTVDGDNPLEMQYLRDHPEEEYLRLGSVPTYEPQMATALGYGYSYADCNVFAKSTRRKPMGDGGTIHLNLDWFYQKGLRCKDAKKIESIFHLQALKDAPADLKKWHGQEMSDHDIVLVTCEIA
ncbi:MAG: hypothetical protein LBQ95_08075 [Lachnospiraceae bacterium]|nr:hypothetical protein [Lachnospiraceae bacterium]